MNVLCLVSAVFFMCRFMHSYAHTDEPTGDTVEQRKSSVMKKHHSAKKMEIESLIILCCTL